MSPPAGFTVIAAVDESGGIGRAGGLPWRLAADMEHFRRVTLGPGDGANAVILGRRTWDSLPPKFRPLPGRRNFVVSGRGAAAAPGARVCPDFAGAWREARAGGGETFVIGGAEIYALALEHPDCARVLLTRVSGDHGCDVRFPGLDRLRLLECGEEREEKGLRYRFCLYAPRG